MNTEQERAAFEAWAASIGFCVTGKYAETIDVLCAESAFKAGYQAGRAALQSQDMRAVIEALETAQNNACGPCRPWGSANPDSDEYVHEAFMWDYYQRAIDHARRIEGDGE